MTKKSVRDRQRHYRHIMYMCDDIGLDKADRLELARHMFDRDALSFHSISLLDDDELDLYIFALKHYQNIRQILVLGGKALEDARRTIAILDAKPEDNV